MLKMLLLQKNIQIKQTVTTRYLLPRCIHH